MTDIWVCFPTGNSEAGKRCAADWMARGFKVACLIDSDQSSIDCNLLIVPPEYPGYVAAQNRLAAAAFDSHADAVLIGGDDIYPGERATPENLSEAYAAAFGDGCGVMQCTGDRYEAMDWCAPFPLIDRSWFNAHGAYHAGYRHYFADQDLREYAIARGRFAECPTIAIEHRHFTRGHADQLPEAKRAAAQQHHTADARLYETRKAAGFP